MESLAHLLVMVNFSSNFLVYCSTSSPFKIALTRVGRGRVQFKLAFTEKMEQRMFAAVCVMPANLFVGPQFVVRGDSKKW